MDINALTHAEKEQAIIHYLRERLAEFLLLPESAIATDQPISGLGLDSLTAVELKYEIETNLQKELSLEYLFTGPSLEELAYTLVYNDTDQDRWLDPQPETGLLPSAYGQKALWYLHQLNPQSDAYHLYITLKIHNDLNTSHLQKALHILQERHPALRTTFVEKDGTLWQNVAPAKGTIPLITTTITPEEPINTALQKAMTQPFDLVAGPLWRVVLLQNGVHEPILLIAMHHIISDLLSLAIFTKELGEAYTALHQSRPLPFDPLVYGFADFAHWQAQQLTGTQADTLKSYWQNKLASSLEPLNLATDHPRPKHQTDTAQTHTFTLTNEQSEQVKELAKTENTTPYTLLLASLHLLLSRYTGQKQIRIGSPTQGRPHATFARLLGYFVNTIVLQADLDQADDFASLLAQVKQTTTEALTHQAYPFAMLVEQLQPERDTSRSPIVQVLFSYQQASRAYEQGTAYFALGLESEPMPFGALTVSAYPTPITSVQFDLSVVVAELNGRFHVSWQYNSDLFKAETMQQMAQSWQTVLTAVLIQPTRPLHTIPALTPAQQQQLTQRNQTQETIPTATLPERIAQQANKTPNKIALVYQAQQLSYQTLNEQANQLAHHLQAHGVKQETAVAIALPRSPQTLIAMLATLKAGGYYIPLDPSYPTERLQYMLSDSASQLLITTPELAQTLTAQATIITLDNSDWQSAPRTTPNTTIDPAQLAYMIYTSGSTGKPKGVQIQHHTVSNFLHSMARTPGLTEDDYLTAVTTISFDIAVLELFLPLVEGATVEMIPKEVSQDAFALAQQISPQTSIMQATPATWKLLLEAGWQGHPQLKILSGGEALSPPLAQQLLARSQSVWNVYGPTETTIWSSVQPISADLPFIPIGHPIANTQLHILDDHLLPVPIGVAGRLFIGGDVMARGYWQRPSLTASRFVPDPFSQKEGARLYNTGDRVRLHSNGLLQYLGREDHQLKIRGFRIEPGEIESTLRQHPAIQRALVMPTADQMALIAVLETEQLPDDLPQFLSQRLPSYMVPHHYHALAQFPLTPNGKIDRLAINQQISQTSTHTNHESIPPSTVTEITLYDIWAEVLGQRPFSIHDQFFALGGHSLLATQIISRVNQAFDIILPLRHLFENPTVAQLATVIDQQSQTASLPPITTTPTVPEHLPLSFAQQQLWLWDQLNPNDPTYNIRVAVRLQGELDLTILGSAFAQVIARHESLRTYFNIDSTTPVQRIAPSLIVPIQQDDLQQETNPEQKAQQLIREESERPFDLSQLPLMRLRLLKLAPEHHILIVTMHHIIADGWSLGLLIHEIAHLYEAQLQNQPSTLPQLPLQYRDFALWQRQYLQGETQAQLRAYWQEQLKAPRALMDIPTDFPRPEQRDSAGATYFFTLPMALQTAVQATSQAQQTTSFTTLLTAFYVLLYSHQPEDDLFVGIGNANRNRIEIEPLIGYFVNQLVLRTNMSGNPTFAQLIQRVHQTQLQASLHQDLPFETVLETLNPKRDLSRTPLFQAKMVWQPPLQIHTIGQVQVSLLDIDNGTAKFDLLLNVRETPHGLWGAFEYSTRLFKETSIQQMVADWHFILQTGAEQPLHTLIQQVQQQRQASQKEQAEARKNRRQQTFKKRKRKAITINEGDSHE